MASDRKTKKNVTVEQTESSVDDIFKLTPIDYLYHTNATDLIKNAMHEVVMYRPDDPIQFLIDYFAPSNEDPILEAYEQLQRCHFTERMYQQNVLEIYQKLMTLKNENTHITGLTGNRFNKLILKCVESFNTDIQTLCMKKLLARPMQVIVFNKFYYAVLLCQVLKDFIIICVGIYKDLDVDNAGKSSHILCQALLDKFEENLSMQTLHSKIGTDKFRDCNTYLLKLNDVMTGIGSIAVMEEEEFVVNAVKTFLSNV